MKYLSWNGYEFSEIVPGMFVDVGENQATLDRINLSFIYDEIGHDMMTAEDKADAVSFAAPYQNIRPSTNNVGLLRYCGTMLALLMLRLHTAR